MNDASSHRPKTPHLIQQLSGAARAAITDASTLILPAEDNPVTISRTTLDLLQTALEDYEAFLHSRAGKALVEIMVTNDNTPLLEIYVAVPPTEAKPLAQALGEAIKKAAVTSKRPAGASAGKIIYFSTPKDKKTGFLSESARTPLVLKGQVWPTVRHYYLAQKYADTGLEDQIRLAISPAAAAAIARGYDLAIRSDWRQAKVEVMREALWAKFAYNKRVRGLLLETGEAMLINHSKDTFWGDGLDGQGKNILGQLLMELRTRLQHEPLSPQPHTIEPLVA